MREVACTALSGSNVRIEYFYECVTPSEFFKATQGYAKKYLIL